MFSMDAILKSNIFYSQLFESMDVEPKDMESQLSSLYSTMLWYNYPYFTDNT
jgi:hypothetical protein